MDLQAIIAEIINQIRGMWRYRWYMVIVAWIVAIPGWFSVYIMPDVYEARAKVLVDTNSLLPGLTEGLTASENLIDEVDIVSRALLTRPNLAAVARQTDIDLRADSPREMEMLITELQQRLSIVGGRDKVFEIAFQDMEQEKAHAVVAALLNTFVESSLGAQGDDAAMTERAIRTEIDDHEERLLAAEATMNEFRKNNIGYMPDDGADYYTRLQTALTAVEDTKRMIRQLSQRRDEIQRQLDGEVAALEGSSESAQALAACSRAGNIKDLQAQLSALEVDFTDKHPRIVMLRDTIAALEQECKDELAAGGGLIAQQETVGPGGEVNTVYQNLRILLSNADVDLAALRERLSFEEDEVQQLRVDVDKIADVETEMKRLNRDYAVVQDRHQELLRRWETLQSKKRLDPITDKVQFNILEPPYVSPIPVSPNRPLLLVAVLILALGAGAAVVFAQNQVKPVFYNRRVLSRVAGLPVLGSVGLIMTRKQLLKRRVSTFMWAGANLSLIGLGVIVVLFDSRISQLVRDASRSAF